MKATIVSLLASLLTIIASWTIVIGFVWLISWCFAFAFTIKIGTGIWLCLCMLNASLKIETKGGK